MRRRAAIALAFLLCGPGSDFSAQQLGVLKIKVTVVDADGRARPVPRHALLVSDNPASAAPRRVVTAVDGTAEIRLKPGNYTIESDQPLIFQGKAYEWLEMLDVPGGRDQLLELTAQNAHVEAAAADARSMASGSASAADISGATILIDWQDSVFSIWSPTALGAGFLIDGRGLIATNQRLVRDAETVEVQLSPTGKIPGRVVASSPEKNVAVIWVDPKAIPSARPVRLGYSQEANPAVVERDSVFSIDTTLDGARNLASGSVSRVNPHNIVNDVRLDNESAGVPLFDAAGDVVGITTIGDDRAEMSRVSTRAVRIDDAKAVIAEAAKKLQGAPPAGKLPLEPPRPSSDDRLKEAAGKRVGSLAPYQVPATDFDVSIITPVMLYAVQHPPERTNSRDLNRDLNKQQQAQKTMRAVEDFGNWSEYFGDPPPILIIRASPKMVESFWTTLARGAAQTQGVAIPAITHLKTGFSSMRLYCGSTEVTPIHPFKIERHMDQGQVINEGVYVFDPAAVGPSCGTVKLTLFSEKAPDKPDTRTLDAKLLQQIAQDFAYLKP